MENRASFLNKKFGCVAAAKKNCGKISIVAQVIRPNVRRTMEKTRFGIWPF